MFQKWSGKIRKRHWRNARLTRNISVTNQDEPEKSSRDSGDIFEDTDELKRRLLPTLTATYEQGGHVTVWRMPTEISQSRLAGRYKPSNACTIIAVKLIEFIYREGIVLQPTQISVVSKRNVDKSNPRFRKWSSRIIAEFEQGVQPIRHCSAQLLNAFINAIIEGNEIHEQQMTKRRPLCSCYDRHTETFTIPQALEGCGNVFQEIEFVTVQGKITYNLKPFLLTPIKSDFLKDHLQIYMILIVYERSVLLVYERECNALFLIDTHSHLKTKNMKTGGLIAMCPVNDLDWLIKWMCKNVFPETIYKLNYDQSFEVSVLTFKGQLHEEDHPLFVPSVPETLHVFPSQPIDQTFQLQNANVMY
uniref:NARG2_C domain-containing protein n=1 Tax=Elaeophora elaphi TaxID=1147741 RepID=A0A0R3RX98_9BILA